MAIRTGTPLAGATRRSRGPDGQKEPPVSDAVADPTSNKRPRIYGRVSVDDIARSTLELLRHHSSEDITITMIADRGGIKRSSIYRYFNGVDEIYRHLSQLYLGKIRPFVESYVRRRKPQTLEEVVVHVVNAAVEFFDEPYSLDRTTAILLQLNVTSFVIEYHQETVSLIASLWDVDWPIEQTDELHPFRVMAMLITAVFEVSLRKHGRITEAYAQETREVALGYIKGVQRRFAAVESATGSGPAEERIGTAVTSILSAGKPQLVTTCVQQLEALARLSSDARF